MLVIGTLADERGLIQGLEVFAWSGARVKTDDQMLGGVGISYGLLSLFAGVAPSACRYIEKS